MARSTATLTREPPAPPQIGPGKAALFTLVALLLLLLCIEGGVRLYHFVRNIGVHEEPPHGYAVEDAEAGYVLRRGYDEGGVRVNSLGFRGAEFAQAKPAGTYRIVTLGDSATWGPTEVECSYPFLLDGLLPGHQTQTINAAVEGYRSDRALVRLRRDVIPLQPDLVTVFIGWNDLYQTDPRAETDQISLHANPLSQLLTLSDAAQTFRRLFFLRFQTAHADTQGLAVGDEQMLSTYRPQGYRERLQEIFRQSHAAGADVVAITWPTLLSDQMSGDALAKAHYPWYTNQLGELKLLYADYQATLRDVAAQEQVPILDAAALFNQVPDKEAHFKDTAHFDCDGQAMIGRALATQLQAGLLGHPLP